MTAYEKRYSAVLYWLSLRSPNAMVAGSNLARFKIFTLSARKAKASQLIEVDFVNNDTSGF